MSSEPVESLYLRDLGALLADAARESAKTVADAAHDFEMGRNMAYYEVISLMIDQAAAFGLDRSSLGLGNLDPDRDILVRRGE